MQELERKKSVGFSHLFFSFRCGTLLITLAGLVMWAFTGFNLEEGAVPFIGLQWSTFSTFFFFFYAMMFNFQIGGIRTFTQFKEGLKADLGYLVRFDRKSYPETHALNGWVAVVVSAMACVAATFAFESLWVLLYDFFQFGSFGWPVYYAVTRFPLPIIRNTVLFALPVGFILLIFSVMRDYKLNIKLRMTGASLLILGLTFSIWAFWLTMPHQVVALSSLTASQVIGPQANTFTLASCYVFPKEQLFPQNTYTFYPCALYGKSYTPPQILGFFDPDPWVHVVNVLAKFATFAAVCFPLMAFVRRPDV